MNLPAEGTVRLGEPSGAHDRILSTVNTKDCRQTFIFVFDNRTDVSLNADKPR